MCCIGCDLHFSLVETFNVGHKHLMRAAHHRLSDWDATCTEYVLQGQHMS